MCGGPSSSLWCVKCDFDDDVNGGEVDGVFRMMMMWEVVMMMVMMM